LPASSARAQSTDAARNLAAACANCHGTNGVAAAGMASLAGQSPQFLSAALKAFRDGQRPGTIMPQLAKGYSDAQIEALAAWFSAQKAR
jgi:cytochrome c553